MGKGWGALGSRRKAEDGNYRSGSEACIRSVIIPTKTHVRAAERSLAGCKGIGEKGSSRENQIISDAQFQKRERQGVPLPSQSFSVGLVRRLEEAEGNPTDRYLQAAVCHQDIPDQTDLEL